MTQTSKSRDEIAYDPTTHSTKMIGRITGFGTVSTLINTLVMVRPEIMTPIVAHTITAPTSYTKVGASVMIIGPGRTPWISIAAISTAAGAEPGMPSVSTGITAPGTHVLSPVSAAINPSIEPLPNFSFSLLARFAAAYDDHAATSSPTPGRMPMNVPINPERRIVFQYFIMSASLGITESSGLS